MLDPIPVYVFSENRKLIGEFPSIRGAAIKIRVTPVALWTFLHLKRGKFKRNFIKSKKTNIIYFVELKKQ